MERCPTDSQCVPGREVSKTASSESDSDGGQTYAMMPIAHRSTFSLCPFPFSRISGAR